MQEFSFAGINRAITGALTSDEVEVWVTYRRDCWDILLDVDAEPKRVPGGGYVCGLCPADDRRVFADRPALWTDHLFEGLLEWMNESLARAKWLALFGDPDTATWARLLLDDDPSQTLRGGGLRLSFDYITGKRSREARDEEPPILVPCRTG